MLRAEKYILNLIKKVAQYEDCEICVILNPPCVSQVKMKNMEKYNLPIEKYQNQIHPIMESLKEKGYIQYEDRTQRGSYYPKLTSQGRYSTEYHIKDFCYLILKSAIFPIIVSIITTIITVSITNHFKYNNSNDVSTEQITETNTETQ